MVYTISTQDTKSKKEFCAAAGLTHTLLADVGGKTAAAYGVLMPERGIARRVTFFIDPSGTVAAVDTQVKAATAAEDSLAKLGQLSTEKRTPLGSGAAVQTENKPNQFVGPASATVTLGAPVPDFALADVSTGKNTAFTTLSAGKKATVVMFIATTCPVSLAYDQRMAQLASEYAPRGVAFVGINSNRHEPVADCASHKESKNLPFPVLKDTDNVLADRFQAQVTPEIFVADARGVLVYHGAIDNSQEPKDVSSRHLAKTLDAVLAGQPVPVPTTRAFGCGIKRVAR